ncbi:MAG: hypothetical protein ACOY4O_05225 [Pseudomonadota bacterium]
MKTDTSGVADVAETDAPLLESLKLFRMRSRNREADVDQQRFKAIIAAIDEARESAAAERDGLVGRIRSLLLRAEQKVCRQSVGMSTRRLGALKREFAHAEARLAELSAQIVRLDQMRSLLNAG